MKILHISAWVITNFSLLFFLTKYIYWHVKVNIFYIILMVGILIAFIYLLYHVFYTFSLCSYYKFKVQLWNWKIIFFIVSTYPLFGINYLTLFKFTMGLAFFHFIFLNVKWKTFRTSIIYTTVAYVALFKIF